MLESTRSDGHMNWWSRHMSQSNDTHLNRMLQRNSRQASTSNDEWKWKQAKTSMSHLIKSNNGQWCRPTDTYRPSKSKKNQAKICNWTCRNGMNDASDHWSETKLHAKRVQSGSECEDVLSLLTEYQRNNSDRSIEHDAKCNDTPIADRALHGINDGWAKSKNCKMCTIIWAVKITNSADSIDRRRRSFLCFPFSLSHCFLAHTFILDVVFFIWLALHLSFTTYIFHFSAIHAIHVHIVHF